MKKALWKQLDPEAAVPARPYPSKLLSTFCAAFDDSSDASDQISGKSVAAAVPVAMLFVVAFVFQRQSSNPRPYYFQLGFFKAEKVPLYLKLGRLIYYS